MYHYTPESIFEVTEFLLSIFINIKKHFHPFFLTNRILVLIRYTRLVVVLGHVQSAYLIT